MKSYVLYRTEGDVTSIDIALNSVKAVVEIEHLPPNEKLYVEASSCHRVFVRSFGTQVKVRTRKGILPIKTHIKIGIPEYLTPSIRVNGKNFEFAAEGGIYKEIIIIASKGGVRLVDTAAESVIVNGGDMAFYASRITIKNSAVVAVSRGDILAENCFASFAEYRNKNGNVGAVNQKFKSGIFEAAGNVTLTVDGLEEDYDITCIAKDGTCNRSDVVEGRSGRIKAYTLNGNVMIDFTQNTTENQL